MIGHIISNDFKKVNLLTLVFAQGSRSVAVDLGSSEASSTNSVFFNHAPDRLHQCPHPLFEDTLGDLTALRRASASATI